ncbi:MAG: hypothetical protein ACE5EX_08955, partial [Phycisphaerae bacterium]
MNKRGETPHGARRTLSAEELLGQAAESSAPIFGVNGLSPFPAPEPQPIKLILATEAAPSVLGDVPIEPVYRNVAAGPSVSIYRPCAGERVADDLRLIHGDCVVRSVTLALGGIPRPGAPPTITADVSFWDGDPCLPDSAVIPNSQAQLVVINDGNARLLTVIYDPATLNPMPVLPETVWLAVRFSDDAGGWVIGDRAELGFTFDSFSEATFRNPDPALGGACSPVPQACDLFDFPQFWSGLWAEVTCESIADPPGACCEGQTCSEIPESQCLSGVWQGPFSTCTPSPCISGACCTDSNLRTCNDVSEADCLRLGGLFRPGDNCLDAPCRRAFKVFENNLDTGVSAAIDTGDMWADDVQLGRGAPCELSSFAITTTTSEVGAPAYDVHVSLWTNDDVGTPFTPDDDIPRAEIAGTATDFVGVPGNATRQRLIAGPFAGIALPPRLWVVVTTSSPVAGPFLSGLGTIGASRDSLAFSAVSPVNWVTLPGQGFDPTGCPTQSTCIAAASFEMDIWCRGSGPSGACCDDASGACGAGVVRDDCPGRWVEGADCDANRPNPPCGYSACCTTLGCFNTLPSNCARVGGAVALGRQCGPQVSCPTGPQTACFGATGDCFSAHPTPGCDDAFCCDVVCRAQPLCCDPAANRPEWFPTCAALAGTLCDLPPACPAVGPMRFTNLVDARQPHPPDDPTVRQTARSIHVDGGPAALPGALDGVDNLLCWLPCETVVEESAIDVASVVPDPSGGFRVNLSRPISVGAAGAVTTVTYTDDGLLSQSGTLTAHPGNVDGDGWAATTDLVRLAECIRGNSCPLWECDIDHSGRCTPADILRAIDLFNVNWPLGSWLNTARPSPNGCP